jgi:hypothetical protein
VSNSNTTDDELPVETLANIAESLFVPLGAPHDFRTGDLVRIRPYSNGRWSEDIYRITWIGPIRYGRGYQVYVAHHTEPARKQMWLPNFADLPKELRHV